MSHLVGNYLNIISDFQEMIFYFKDILKDILRIALIQCLLKINLHEIYLLFGLRTKNDIFESNL